MTQYYQDPNGHRPSDKIRVRVGPYKGLRGTLVAELEPAAEFQVELSTGETIVIAAQAITNYSLAARRAWQAMPKRAGRPHSLEKKKMVSIRVEAVVWNALGQAVELGIITSREQAINDWLREKLKSLAAGSTALSVHTRDQQLMSGGANG